MANRKFSELDQAEQMKRLVEYAANVRDPDSTLDDEFQFEDENGEHTILVGRNYWLFDGTKLRGIRGKVYAIVSMGTSYDTVDTYPNSRSVQSAWKNLEKDYYAEVEVQRKEDDLRSEP